MMAERALKPTAVLRLCLAIALVLVFIAACGGNGSRSTPSVGETTPTASNTATLGATPRADGLSFQEALASGEDCGILFQIRNSLDSKADDLDEMNDDLRRIGCHGSSSSRTDLSEPEGFEADADYSPQQYKSGYDGCAYSPAQVFDEAGTRDPQSAAVWYADLFFGSTARGAYAGCLDALEDKPSRFP